MLFIISYTNMKYYPGSCNNALIDFVSWKNYVLRTFSLDEKVQPIFLDIKSKHLKILAEDRANALKDGNLIIQRKVPAKLRINKKQYSARVRLKGDLKDHWNKHFWSLRVEMKNKHFRGMKVFSLQLPHTRNFIVEPTFMEEARRLGLIAPRYGFVNIFLNGKDQGLVAFEEHISKEILESHSRKEGIVLRYSDKDAWTYNSNNNYVLGNPYQNMFITAPKIFNSKKILKNKSLNPFANYAKYLLYSYQEGTLRFDQVFDAELMVKALLLGDMWKTHHPVYWPNAKYYLNPFTLRLEPIIFDNGHEPKISNTSYNFTFPYSYPLNEVPRSLIKKYLEKNRDYLLERKKNQEDVDKYYDQISSFEHCRSFDIMPVLKNKKTLLDKGIDYYDVDNSRETQIQRMAEISGKDWNTNRENVFHKHIEAHYDLNKSILTIKNFLPFEVLVEKVQLIKESDSSIQEFKLNKLLTGNTPMFGRKHFKYLVPMTEDVKSIQIITSMDNAQKTFIIPKVAFIHSIKDTTYETSGIPSFVKKEGSNFIINAGKWIFKQSMIIGAGSNLLIKAGAELKMGKDVHIIINGDLTLKGEESKPIIFKALNKTQQWQGIFVRKGNTIIDHAIISDIKSINRFPLVITGAITLYHSKVKINNLTINNVNTEDGLNIFGGVFNLTDLKVNNTLSDALDIDFSKGTIQKSSFFNVKGDALDFSGTKVTISDVTAKDVKDKAFSLGEKTDARIKNVSIQNAGSGIVSKDGSTVIVDSARILNTPSPLMVYTKKTEYTQAIMDAINVTSDNNNFLLQKGNEMKVDGKNILPQDVDVKKMYQSGTMKKK